MVPVGTDDALGALAEVVRRSGPIDPMSTGVVLVSGGADSACAAAGLARAIGPARVHALHVNYGLRQSADRDERVCRDLCSRLRIDLHIERPQNIIIRPQLHCLDCAFDCPVRSEENDWGLNFLRTGQSKAQSKQ